MDASYYGQRLADQQLPCLPGGNPDGYPADRLAYLNGSPVGFGGAIRQASRNRFTYRGRASRSAYWWHALFGLILYAAYDVIASVFAAMSGGASGQARTHAATGANLFTVLIILIFLALVLWFYWLPAHALTVRRLHDVGKSGWWQMTGPLALILLSLKGTPESNRYQL